MFIAGPVHVRRAATGDAAQIAGVHVAAWQAAHAGLGSSSDAGCLPVHADEEPWRREIQGQSPERAPWVALIDDRVVGVASGGLSDDGDPGTGEVYLIDVHPGHWRLGIGSSLLRHVLRDLRAHGFDRATTWVVDGCLPARGFLEHHLWVADGSARLGEHADVPIREVRYQRTIR